jgi:uncharacterized protein YdgA (DUF945 family)
VKPILLGSILAACLLSAAPVIAAAPPKAAPTSRLMDAMLSLLREFDRANDPKLPLPAVLDRMATQAPAPETAAKLQAVFGTERPYAIERRPAKAGHVVYHATLQPLHYQSASNGSADWDEATLDFDFDKSGTRLDLHGNWDTLDFQHPALHATVHGVQLSGQQRRGFAGIWFGDVRVRAADAHLVASAPGAGPADAAGDIALHDLLYDWRVSEGRKTVDMGYQGSIGKIVSAGEEVDDLRIAIRMANVDKQALAALRKETERQRAMGTGLSADQKAQAMLPLMRRFGAATLAHGASIEIDEISARYHGNKASITGRITAPGASEADLRDLPSALKKLVARFEIKVPLAIVRDIAGAVAAKQAAAQQGNAAAVPVPTAQLGQTVTDVIVGKLVGGGFARVENDALVSTVEWRDGALRADGKPVPMPNLTPASPSPSTQIVSAGASLDLPAAPLPPDALRPRRIEASCSLPDYPDEVVSQNRPLRLVLSYRIATDGKVLDPAIASASRFPAWDQAALAALAHCTYLPALKSGKPVELPMVWTIQREPGTARP